MYPDPHKEYADPDPLVLLCLLPKMADTVLKTFSAGGASEVLLAGSHPVVQGTKRYRGSTRILVVQIFRHHLMNHKLWVGTYFNKGLRMNLFW